MFINFLVLVCGKYFILPSVLIKEIYFDETHLYIVDTNKKVKVSLSNIDKIYWIPGQKFRTIKFEIKDENFGKFVYFYEIRKGDMPLISWKKTSVVSQLLNFIDKHKKRSSF